MATAGVLLFKGGAGRAPAASEARRLSSAASRSKGFGCAHTRRCIHKAVHTQGGLWPPQESCYLRAHRQGGTRITRCTHKAVHTQCSAHTRRCGATAGVLLFKGGVGSGLAASEARCLLSAASRSKGFGCAHTRWCIHKAVHTQGGAHTRQSVATHKGAYIRRCTHKAVHTQGGLWPPQESCYLRAHKQGGTHITQYTHKVVHTQSGLWPPQESCYLRGVRGPAPAPPTPHHRAKRGVRQAQRAAERGGGGGGYGRGEVRWGQLGAYCPRTWVLLFQEAHGVGDVSERAGSSAGRTTTRRFGRPEHRPAVSAGFWAEILGGGLGRPTPPLAPSLSAKPHRRRASPPFHSDELHQRTYDLPTFSPHIFEYVFRKRPNFGPSHRGSFSRPHSSRELPPHRSECRAMAEGRTGWGYSSYTAQGNGK